MSVMVPPRVQFPDAPSGYVYTYEAGTSTPLATYPTESDALAGTNANANPYQLDTAGSGDIFLRPGSSYKIDVKTALLISISGYPVDNITDIGSLLSSWRSPLPATYLSATSYRYENVDRTSELSVGQLVKMEGGAGRYGKIKSYSFTTHTDVELYPDSIRDSSNAASTVHASMSSASLSIQSLGADGAIVPYYPVQSYETGVVDASYPIGDIRRYGAIASSTNNSTEIQNAIDSSYHVFVPEGVFSVTSKLVVSRSGTTIYGVKGKSTIYGKGAGVDVMWFSDSAFLFNGAIRDIVLRGDSTAGDILRINNGAVYCEFDAMDLITESTTSRLLVGSYTAASGVGTYDCKFSNSLWQVPAGHTNYPVQIYCTNQAYFNENIFENMRWEHNESNTNHFMSLRLVNTQAFLENNKLRNINLENSRGGLIIYSGCNRLEIDGVTVWDTSGEIANSIIEGADHGTGSESIGTTIRNYKRTFGTFPAGPVQYAVIAAGGSSFAIGDTLTLTGGTGDAVLTVTGVSGGGITSLDVTTAGTTYASANNVAWTTSGSGSGAQINIAAGAAQDIDLAYGQDTLLENITGLTSFAAGRDPQMVNVNGKRFTAINSVEGISGKNSTINYVIINPGSSERDGLCCSYATLINILIAKTIQDSGASAGVEMRESGTWMSATGNPLTLNRLAASGGIINMSINGTNVGAIGYDATTSKLYVDYAGSIRDLAGSGTPEGTVSAAVGSTYRRSDGGASTSFYVKESGGAGNTGWVAK